MSASRHDPLFQAPGIMRAHTQHIDAMIRFDYDRVTTPEFIFHQWRDVAKVCKCCDLDPSITSNKSEVVYGIMRHSEGFKIYVPDAELSAGFYFSRSPGHCLSSLQ